MKYRADIDGLRAVAVLLVLASHLEIGRLAGGFIGVDVFFVISGYLIGALVHNEIKADVFSILRFYERRIRRIVPALSLVLFVTLVAGWIILLPKDLCDYARSLLAAVASVSNIFFWQSSGYFDSASAQFPLRHTWSLGVEEQFYIVFPLLMLAVTRLFPRRLTLVFWLVAAVSLLVSAIQVSAAPTAAFYLLPSRAWELTFGLLVALRAYPRLTTPAMRHLTGLAGLALIAGSALLLKASTPFPGLSALPACLGAAAIIAAGQDGGGAANRLLALKPAVFIGLISYSLYLWHWPLIVFFKSYLVVDLLTREEKVGLAAISIVLAVLSWRFVEAPFRSKRMSARAVCLSMGAAMAALSTAGVAILLFGGAPARFPPRVERIAAFLQYAPSAAYREETCFLKTDGVASAIDRAACLTPSPDRPNVLLWGDSHAAHLWSGLSRVMPEANLMQSTVAACSPTEPAPPGTTNLCRSVLKTTWDETISSGKVDGVILSAYWLDQDLANLARTLDQLKAMGIRALVIGPITGFDAAVPTLMARASQNGDPDLPIRHLRRDRQAMDAKIARVAAEHGAAFVSIQAAMCGSTPCVMTDADGLPLQWDNHHLTAEGSLAVARALRAKGVLDFERRDARP